MCRSWASYQIRNIAGGACAGNAGNVFPRRWLQRKLLVSDPGMHDGTCVTHVPWCMLGSLASCGGENVPGIPGACTSNFPYLARGPCTQRSISEIPQCTWPISHNASFRTEMCTFLFWMVLSGIWDRYSVEFVNLVFSWDTLYMASTGYNKLNISNYLPLESSLYRDWTTPLFTWVMQTILILLTHWPLGHIWLWF